MTPQMFPFVRIATVGSMDGIVASPSQPLWKASRERSHRLYSAPFPWGPCLLLAAYSLTSFFLLRALQGSEVLREQLAQLVCQDVLDPKGPLALRVRKGPR